MAGPRALHLIHRRKYEILLRGIKLLRVQRYFARCLNDCVPLVTTATLPISTTLHSIIIEQRFVIPL